MARWIALTLFLLSLTMLIPLGLAVVRLIGGADLPPDDWRVPLLILTTGATLLWLLSRKQLPLLLYLTAFGLWVVAAGYFWISRSAG
ncbi:MAG TPA: hypothetical protein VNL91_07070 [Thermoanaerobaculia bacterium]|nr:hypothetical protein [Thermoanaerobaculia bacterium]